MDGAVLVPSIKMETGLDGPIHSLTSLLHKAQEGFAMPAKNVSGLLVSPGTYTNPQLE